MAATREELSDLLRKYAEILAMRTEATSNRAATASRMAALAARFPGALRETDDLELREIRRRMAAIQAALRGERAIERWMEALALFHSLARGALCAKRWLGKRKRIDASVERAFTESLSTLQFPDDARAWAHDLARVASPPRGRLNDAIFARLASTLGVSDRDARVLAFGLPRRERG